MFSVHSSPMGELGTRDTGGMSVYIRELARELSRHGHRVDIFTRSRAVRLVGARQLCDGVRLVHLPAGGAGPLQALALYPHLPDFSREFRDFYRRSGLHYDIIHSHYWLSAHVGSWVQEWWNIPHMITFHTLGAVKNLTGREAPEPDVRIRAERHLAATCTRVLTAAAREKNHLVQLYGVSAEKVGVVPCGVNLELFQPLEKAAARRRLGLPQDAAVVLYVGRLAALKGLDRLLTAVALLPERHGLHLLIVGGDGPHAPEAQSLRRLARDLGVDEQTALAGRVAHEALPAYYSAADVLAVPSHYESFGLVALESLACGTPVVATAVGAMESLVGDGATGRVVTETTPRAFADALASFLGRPRAATLSPSRIRASVEAFRWSAMAAAVVEEYRAAIEQHRRLVDMGLTATVSAA
jgi:D-inositol-3-phosphate glycosyltransferase